jgi:hypothetical protein
MAYKLAVDDGIPTRQQNGAMKPAMTRANLVAGDPAYSAGFLDLNLPDGVIEGLEIFPCSPLDPALEVVAPFSTIVEARPASAGALSMPWPRMQAPACLRGIEVAALASKAPRTAIPVLDFPVTGARLLHARTPDGVIALHTDTQQLPASPPSQNIARWALLSMAFCAIAVTTRWALTAKGEAPPQTANHVSSAAFEDFSNGLDHWDGAEGRNPWKLERSKGAMPRSLALFKPSRGMADYRLEFTAEVEKNGISWVIRAANPRNYQALRVAKRTTAAGAELWLTRYAVAGGKEGPHTDIPLQIVMPPQPLWLVRLESFGDTCTLWIEDQIANSWSEPSVPFGSIGFFSAYNDQFMLKKVRITPQ